jgi:hypothetical protein
LIYPRGTEDRNEEYMTEYRVEFIDATGDIKHLNTFARHAKEARANIKRSQNVKKPIEIIKAFKLHKH